MIQFTQQRPRPTLAQCRPITPRSPPRKTFVYKLRLKDGMWYVGTTDNPAKRLQDHRRGDGSQWTQRHPPMAGFQHKDVVYFSEPQAARLEEDKKVKELMLQHGVERVRGGSYSACELSSADLNALRKELWHAQDCCIRCGRRSHYAVQCFAKRDVDGNALEAPPASGVDNERRRPLAEKLREVHEAASMLTENEFVRLRREVLAHWSAAC